MVWKMELWEKGGNFVPREAFKSRRKSHCIRPVTIFTLAAVSITWFGPKL